MTDNNINRTVVRKEDLHQEVGTLRHADNGTTTPNNLYPNRLKHITEHNYRMTSITRNEGLHETSNQKTPDYSAPLPSYMGPATNSVPLGDKQEPADFLKNNAAPAEGKPASAPIHDAHIHNTISHAPHSPTAGATAEPKTHVQPSHTSLNKVEDVAPKEKGAGSKMIKVLVILGVLILLFFISIGIVKFVPKAIGSLSSASVYLSNLFSKDGIELTLDKSKVKTNDTLTISWKNTSDKTGLYAWSFKCTDGISVFYKSMDGSQKPVVCETSFPIPDAATNYPFVFKSLQNEDVDVPMTLSLFNKETKELLYSDSAEVTVTNSASEPAKPAEPVDNGPVYNPGTGAPSEPATSTPPTTGTPANPETPGTRPAAQVGPTDMSISLVQASSIESGTINVKGLTQVGPNDKVIVRFKIANGGTSATGAWKITAALPTRIAADQAFVSNAQPSLQPGKAYEMTLMFDSYNSSKNSISITVENTNDTNSNNNILTIPISGTSTGATTTNTGRADLAVRIIDVGIMDPYTNAFYHSNSFSSYNKVAVKFEVENKGGTNSGYWSMRIDLPTEERDYQIFGPLTPLTPGQKIEFIIGFDNTRTGNQTVNIKADYRNDVSESNKSNNDASQSIYINR